MNQDRIIQKIKHCLALGQSANENEAALALKQAHAMMSKHNISMSDINLSDVKSSDTEETLAKIPMNYQAILANMIAQKFGCEVYLRCDTQKQKHVLCYVGIDLYSKIASYAFDVLSRQLKKFRRQYIKTHLKRVRIKKNKYARADKFCLGWVSKVEDLVSTLQPPEVDKKLIESKMQALQLVDRTPQNRSKSAPKSTSNDFANGWLDGESANLHNAMKSDTNKPTLLEKDQ